jgi:hypothetical protein
VGTFDAFTSLVNLAVAMGMLGVAATVVDAASEFLVSNFDDQKYADRNDFMTLEALKEYALEQGILDRYAAKTWLDLLVDDVMKAIRERSVAEDGRTRRTQRMEPMKKSVRRPRRRRSGANEKSSQPRETWFRTTRTTPCAP